VEIVVGRLYPPATQDGFRRAALWEEPISVLARADHPILAGAGPVTREALARCELVLPTVSQRVGQEIEQLLSLLDLAPAAPTRSSSYGFIREMLLATDCLSVMPRLMMAGDLLRGALRVVPLPIPAPPRPAGLILRPDRAISPAAAAFLAALREHLAEIAAKRLADMPDDDSWVRRSDRTARRRRA
jgi:LysR family pca operon transcriptional activator